MTRITLAVFSLLATFTLVKVSGERRHYNGYQVLRVLPSSEKQLKSLASLENEGVDFWMRPRGVGLPADVMVSPEDSMKMRRTFSLLGLQAEVWIEDVEDLIENERVRMDSRQNKEMNWEEYQTYETIVDWLDSLIATNDEITSETFGQTTEGRDLRVYKLSTGTTTNGTAKPAFWIDATIHAREWISTATITYVINQLVTQPQNYTDILNAVDFYFVPFVNPDGYKFSFSNDRLWRKTRSNYANYTGDCIGVDANRNFGFHYGEDDGSSSNPCSLTYRGPNAYSEPEAKAVENYILSNANQTNWNTFITLHSYSQLWMSPYGYSATILPDDYQEMKALSDDAVAALTALYGTSYQTGNAGGILYTSSGSSRDWAKGEGGFKYVYTIELRDTGRYGFVLPPDQILPTATETWAGIQVVARNLVSK